MRSMVAGSAELSRSLFVARSRDVIGMERDWCGAWWRGGLSSHGVCLWHVNALRRLQCRVWPDAKAGPGVELAQNAWTVAK